RTSRGHRPRSTSSARSCSRAIRSCRCSRTRASRSRSSATPDGSSGGSTPTGTSSPTCTTSPGRSRRRSPSCATRPRGRCTASPGRPSARRADPRASAGGRAAAGQWAGRTPSCGSAGRWSPRQPTHHRPGEPLATPRAAAYGPRAARARASARRPCPTRRWDMRGRFGFLAAAIAMLFGGGVPARGDETCLSPYMPKITGQEDWVYVWTLGVEGLGDGSDKLVTVGANPKDPATYGKVVSSTSVGGRHEAHHGDFTEDRRFLWLGGLDDSLVWVFDVASDPARPKLVKTITTFTQDSGGVVGPHTFDAIPGRMLITGLSNAKDRGGRTGLVEYNNDG